MIGGGACADVGRRKEIGDDREQVGTRYLALFIRTFIDPNDPADLAAAHALQDKATISQASVGSLDLPAWDHASLDAVRAALATDGTMYGAAWMQLGLDGPANNAVWFRRAMVGGALPRSSCPAMPGRW